MAGKRIYITIPKHDYELLRHLAATGKECPGQWIRRQTLLGLYYALQVDLELQDYDAQLQADERREVLYGRPS